MINKRRARGVEDGEICVGAERNAELKEGAPILAEKDEKEGSIKPK